MWTSRRFRALNRCADNRSGNPSFQDDHVERDREGIGKGASLPGPDVAATLVPGDKVGAWRDDRHLDRPCRERRDGDALRLVQQRAADAAGLLRRVDAEHAEIGHRAIAPGQAERSNQVDGPSFQLDKADAAMDEARVNAVTKARARAELYARAAGLKVVRVLTISEAGGYSPQPPMLYARADKMMMASPAPSPVAAGELDLTAQVTITFELAPL